MNYPNQKMVDEYDAIAALIPNGSREEFFPSFINTLNLKKVAEIGVDTGKFSFHLLNNTNIEEFYGIDNWMDDFGSNHRPGYFDPQGENRFAEAKKRLKQFIPERCNLIKSGSVEMAKTFEDGELDFVYIDGDHTLEMLFDLYAWVPKVRLGGIVGFDDLKDGINGGIQDYFGNQLPFRVKTCVEFFCQRYGFKLNVFGRKNYDAWFMKNR